ncbi:hypothetical protein, partial [Azospirillum sp.]|nr:hypothetical protein [Azospirillum sp.]HYD67440.1 hypothetical protein [Azospirillum sp.]
GGRLLGAPGLPGGANTAVLGNTAAGIGNKAVQQGMVFQGAGFGTANTLAGQNTAAGIGNFAGQSLFSVQR